jgi:hypothetical protein
MARIDINQSINNDDVKQIKAWLYRQKGVDHVLVNPDTRIVVFTFYPAKVSGNAIAKRFNTDLPYKCQRFMPSETDLRSGCPVAGSSFYFKVYKLIDHIL